MACGTKCNRSIVWATAAARVSLPTPLRQPTPGTKVLMKSGRSLKDLVEKLAETGQLEQAVLVANCGLDQEMVCTDLRALPEGAGYYTTILVKE